MKPVSTAYHASGRSRQKQRTRDLLLAAARTLIESGDTPTVDEVARESGISRTTAYRYFSGQAELLAAAFPETAVRSMLPEPAPADVEDRVREVARATVGITALHEHQQRAMLRLSLDERTSHELPLRQGRAIGWYAEALEPLTGQLDPDALGRLAMVLRAVSGIEARVWLLDIARLETAEVDRIQEWMALALLAQARTPDGGFPVPGAAD